MIGLTWVKDGSMIVILMRREQSETVCATLRETTIWGRFTISCDSVVAS